MRKVSKIEKELQRALESFPKLLAANRKANTARLRDIKRFESLARRVNEKVRKNLNRPDPPPPVHPWRLCPAGKHWVTEHPVRLPQSRKNPPGSATRRRGHCAKNRSRKDQLYPDEMQEMAALYFPKGTPLPSSSRIGFNTGDEYDLFIYGWTTYWNDVLKPETPLEPSLVKALIASESSFNPGAKEKTGKNNFARGLMQITDETRKILRDERGELNDQLVNISDENALDPNLNIAAGTRWLFQKKKLASIRLKRAANWEEAVEEYKAVLSKRLKAQKYNPKLMERFRKYRESLR